MSDWRHSLKPGDEVWVRMDSGELTAHTIESKPWQLSHGAWVVSLSGISGGYDLSRVAAKKAAEPANA